MNKTLDSVLGIMMICAYAAHAERAVQAVDAGKFNTFAFQQIDAKILIYSDNIASFADWAQQAPAERQSLVLYPGYDEPTVTVVKNSVQKKQKESLMVFESRFKLVLNKAPAQIDLKKLISLDTINRFDGEIKHVQIQPNQLMSAVAGKGQIANFKWCNNGAVYFLRPAKEVELSYTNPKTRAWCSDTARSICVESCYLFNSFWYEGVKAVNLGMEESEKKDYGIALQSEIRYFSTEQELGLPVKVSDLTGLNTPVRGGLEQNMFYFDQVIEFGKIIAVLQDHPSDPTKTAATVFFVIGIKKRTYNQFAEVRRVLLGQSVIFNTKTGITAGLPVFTQNMVKSIAGILEN